MGGACDGGLHVPHSVTKYPGYFREEEDDFNKQFAKWNKCLQSAKVETVEALYKKIHEGIRKDPVHKKVEHKKQAVNWQDDRRTVVKTSKGEYMRARKFTLKERNAALQMRIQMAK